ENFKQVYKKLTTEFSKDLEAENYSNITEPFLPLFGELYFDSKHKIMIIGIETKGWGNMQDFINQSKSHPEKAILRNLNSFRNLDFLKWGNNFGRSFWDFNFKFLANFYGIEEWKTVKNGQNEEVLKSFAWGNCNSLEDFHVTANKNNVRYEDWYFLKEKSRKIDKLKYPLETLKPNIILILNWKATDNWITASDEKSKKEIIDNYIHYYYLPKFKTHIIKTAHPTFLSSNKIGIDFDEINKKIAETFKEKIATVNNIS